MSMTDRERAIQAIRRGAPLGDYVPCSCNAKPPTRNGCFGVCEDAVAAIIASYEAIRAESHSQLVSARAALKPFSEIADLYNENEDDQLQLHIDCHEADIRTRLTLGNCRRARIALTDEQGSSK